MGNPVILAALQPTVYAGVADPVKYETRIIVLAQGIEWHDQDIDQDVKKEKLLPRCKPPLDYLLRTLGKMGFQVHEDAGKIKEILSKHHMDIFQSVRRLGTYVSKIQKVEFIIIPVVSKRDFKLALETEGLLVIYDGHSRYGRGACFDTYTGEADQRGNQWEGGAKGKEEETGLFRLGYPYVPVSKEDLFEHEYDFTPVPIEDGLPPSDHHSRHPRARAQLHPMTINAVTVNKVTKNLEPHALVSSPSGRYFGLKVGPASEPHLLLKAGWTRNTDDPHDPCAHTVNLGTTNMVCKAYCIFSCHSYRHFHDIVREYYGWKRPSPPTDRYAYFTTDETGSDLVPIWLNYLLCYNQENKDQPWLKSLEWTKKQTNHKLFTLQSTLKTNMIV